MNCELLGEKKVLLQYFLNRLLHYAFTTLLLQQFSYTRMRKIGEWCNCEIIIEIKMKIVIWKYKIHYKIHYKNTL